MSSSPPGLPHPDTQESQLELKQQDPWAHAGSLENERMLQDRKTELEHMRMLFMNVLPVGKNRDDIISYFNRLEELIFTKGHESVKNEQFPDDPDGIQREYKYFSASISKERASKPQILPDQSLMDTPSDNAIDSGDELSSENSEHEFV